LVAHAPGLVSLGSSAMQLTKASVAAVMLGGAHTKNFGSALVPMLEPQARTTSRFTRPLARSAVMQLTIFSI